MIVFTATVLLLPGVSGASDRLDYTQLKSVVRIETAPAAGRSDIGCGFLVASDPLKGGRMFLVTNKHMIGDWNIADGDVENPHPWIDVFFYRTVVDNAGRSYRSTRINLLSQSGQLDTSRVRMHQSSRVDVVAIDITDKVKDASENIAWTAYERSYFLTFDRIEAWQTGIGDEVIALGYPYNIRSLRTDYPVAKIAYVASAPGEQLSLPIPPVSNRRNVVIRDLTLEGKYLLVDGLITNGNSGGPVLLVGGTKIRHDPKTKALQFLDQDIPNYVIGIVSSGYPGSGLSIVVSSDYILELVDSNGKQ